MKELIIIGGGLAGSEAAWQAAELGIKVKLFEMRPVINTEAHRTANLAELICSNSLGSKLPDRATGLLIKELSLLNSLLVRCAEETAVPAGGALAVDRDKFSALVTKRIEKHENIEIIREEVKAIPTSTTIISSGPLTSQNLSAEISRLTGQDHLYFFDAIAPVVDFDSINMEIAFRASRYDRGETDDGDYINCPFTKEAYYQFVEALTTAETIELKDFEAEIKSGVKAGQKKYFEGCLPIEVIASRGENSLAFGPMRPVGIFDPHTQKRPFAVVQLRQDNLAGSLYNLVGFQTNLKFSEQKRIFQMIPGLEDANFIRYGQMHRNTFMASPHVLHPTMQFKMRSDLFFAGQLTGVEGYMGNIATGLLAGINAARFLSGHSLIELPKLTMSGALCHYITNADMKDFQPMKANFGLMPPFDEKIKGKRNRAAKHAEIALNEMQTFLRTLYENT
jgi:methylenetetrahydrofolate--tRNA-(uracil-5-)-methyltransferase